MGRRPVPGPLGEAAAEVHAWGTGYRRCVTDMDLGFMSLIGAHAPEAAEGKATPAVEVDERHLNPAGTVHGGMLATLVDSTMGAAIRSAVGDETPATSQLSLTYLRPGEPGRLVVTATVRKRGENLTVCEADVEQDGKSLVHALATFALGVTSRVPKTVSSPARSPVSSCNSRRANAAVSAPPPSSAEPDGTPNADPRLGSGTARLDGSGPHPKGSRQQCLRCPQRRRRQLTHLPDGRCPPGQTSKGSHTRACCPWSPPDESAPTPRWRLACHARSSAAGA